MENSDEKLLSIFINVNEWLKFAETKNAMLIGFNGVCFFGIVQLICADNIKLNNYANYYLYYVMVFLAISALCALLSFVPRIKILGPNVFNFHSTDNFLYFDSLRCKTQSEILEEFYPSQPHSKYQKHLADQIISNSAITNKKYTYFTLGIWFCLCGIFTFPLAIILLIHTYKNL